MGSKVFVDKRPPSHGRMERVIQVTLSDRQAIVVVETRYAACPRSTRVRRPAKASRVPHDRSSRKNHPRRGEESIRKSTMKNSELYVQLYGGCSILRSGFMPHGMCYLWNPTLIRLHLLSDLLIGASYVVIFSGTRLVCLPCKKEHPVLLDNCGFWRVYHRLRSDPLYGDLDALDADLLAFGSRQSRDSNGIGHGRHRAAPAASQRSCRLSSR